MANEHYTVRSRNHGYPTSLEGPSTPPGQIVWESAVQKEVVPAISQQNIDGSIVPIPYNCLNFRRDKSKKLVFSIIKADIGGLGGHISVHPNVITAVQQYIFEHTNGEIASFFICAAGDDISINCLHELGLNHKFIHELCYHAFESAVQVARGLGLYGPGQDLLVAGRSQFERTGNVQGSGPACAEIELDPNQSQHQVACVWADKTDPGSFSIPLYKIFGSFWDQHGSILSDSNIKNGYWFLIERIELKKAAERAKITEEALAAQGHAYVFLHSYKDAQVIAAVMKDRHQFAVRGIYGTGNDGKPTRMIVSASTDKLHNIGGKYLGKDDPVMVMLSQKDQPAPGELIGAGWVMPFLVAGNCRGSHNAIQTPSTLFGNTAFRSNPIVTSASVSVYGDTGYIGGLVDNFFGSSWDQVRREADIHGRWFERAHGFFEPVVLPTDQLEYQKLFNDLLAVADKRTNFCKDNDFMSVVEKIKKEMN